MSEPYMEQGQSVELASESADNKKYWQIVNNRNYCDIDDFIASCISEYAYENDIEEDEVKVVYSEESDWEYSDESDDY